MNIKEAKEQIKNAMTAYFTKDEFGNYAVPVEKQRPVFLMGPPGIGKTAIMEQIAQELDVCLVSYSMTHHTRQSALGLPFIEKKVFDGKEVQVSEYTMSEIIATVYETMEATGKKEGILFLDEINCVSETLAPSMLQFLQYKVFGRHRVPEGWIVVTAGNPPEYNRSVREFDIVTWDRLKRIDVEPDFDAWKEFGLPEARPPGGDDLPGDPEGGLLQGGVHGERQAVRHRPGLGRSEPDDPPVRAQRPDRGREAGDPVSPEPQDRQGVRRLLRPLQQVPQRLPGGQDSSPARPPRPSASGPPPPNSTSGSPCWGCCWTRSPTSSGPWWRERTCSGSCSPS